MSLSRHRRRLIGLAGAIVVLVGAGLIVALLRGGGSDTARAKACLPYRVRQAALAASTSPKGATTVPDFSHVVLIMMENKECSQVVGSPAAPYLNQLGRQYAVLRDLYATRHPSFPNYVALTAGSTLGAKSDCPSCVYGHRNLVDQLEAAHISWRAYAEDMPSPCSRVRSVGNYAKRHLPFLSYTDIIDNPRRCANVVPLTQLQLDLRDGALPRFAWITPNLCDDMHNCGVASGDGFVKRTVPALLNAVGPRGVIIITWDEGTTNRSCCSGRAKGGNIPTFVLGGAVRPHSAPITVYDSYSILRTIEGAWRLPHLGEAGCPCTPTIGDIWRQ
jgi:phosphatidylinositol-3-phosphatase